MYTSQFGPFETLTNLAKKICISGPSCGLGVAQVMGSLGLGWCFIPKTQTCNRCLTTTFSPKTSFLHIFQFNLSIIITNWCVSLLKGYSMAYLRYVHFQAGLVSQIAHGDQVGTMSYILELSLNSRY